MSTLAEKPLRRSRLFWIALAIGALGALGDLLVLRASVPDLRDDVWEYGVVAEHLLAGHGFRTNVVHPPLLGLLDRRDGTVPVLIHGPLMPALLAPLVAVLDEAALLYVGWLGAVFLLLAAWPLFRLTRTLTDEPTAALAAGLLPWTPLAWQALNHDAVLLLGVLLFVLALDALLGARPRPGVAGLWCGLCYLARAETLLLAPLLAVAAARGAGREPLRAAGGVARFALGFAACALPWLIHNARATGMPFFNLSAYLLVCYWPPYFDLAALMDSTLTPAHWLASAPALLHVLPAKFAGLLPHAVKLTLLQPTPWSAPLTLIGLGVLARRARAFTLIFAGVLVLLTALMSATVFEARYLALALPGTCVAAAAGARLAASWLPGRARLTAAAVLLAALVLPASIARVPRDPEARWRQLDDEAVALHEAGAAREPMVVLSDIPDFVAWRTGWPVVWVDPVTAPRQLGPTARAVERWVEAQSHFAGHVLWLSRTRARGGPPPGPTAR
jgi:hypothetical protein